MVKYTNPPYKVLLVGYNGANNTGSEARLLSIIEDVRGVLGPNTKITVPTLNEENLRRYLSEDEKLHIAPIPSIFFFSIDKLVAEHDLVLLVEGSCYMDTWTSALLWAFLWATSSAHRRKKPCMAYAVGAGDLSRFNSWLVKREASKTDLIITRTSYATEKLEKIGVTAPIVTTADCAFTFQEDPQDHDFLRRIWPESVSGYDPTDSDTGSSFEVTNDDTGNLVKNTNDDMDNNAKGTKWVASYKAKSTKGATSNITKTTNGVVGLAVVDFSLWPVVIRPWGRKKDVYKWPYYFSRSSDRQKARERLVEGWVRVADKIIEKHRKNVALICMEELDQPLAEDIQRKMKNKDNCRVISSGDYNASQMTSMLSDLDLLVTSRYHSAVLTLRSRVPQIAVGHDPRLSSLYHDLHLYDDYFLSHDMPNLWEVVEEKVDLLIATPDLQKDPLEKGLHDQLSLCRQNPILLHEFLREKWDLNSEKEGLKSII